MMTNEEITGFRNLLKGMEIRIIHLSLDLHKEQERIESLIRILDTQLIKGDQNG